MPNQSMSFRLPEELAEVITAQAQKEGRNKSSVVIDALNQALIIPRTQTFEQQLSQLTDKIVQLSMELAQSQEFKSEGKLQDYCTVIEKAFSCLFRSIGFLLSSQPSASGLLLKTLKNSLGEMTGEVQREANSQAFQSATAKEQPCCELKDCPQPLEQILAASPDPIFVCDRLGRFSYLNPAGSRLLGLERNQVYGKTWLELGLPPDLAEQQLKESEIVFATGRSIKKEICFPTSCGGSRDYEYMRSPIHGVDGSVEAVFWIARDITERKHAEMLLSESEQNYRHLFEFAPDSIFLIDVNTFGIVKANFNASRRLGYTRTELLKLSVSDINVIVSKSTNYEAYRKEIREKLLASGSVIFECEHRRKDGTTIPVEVSSRVIEYQNRLVCLSFVRDISERKQTGKALMRSEERFRMLVNSLDVGVMLQGANAEILFCNPAALTLLGTSKSQLLGKTCFDPDWNVIHEDGSPFPGEMHPVPQAIATRQAVRNVVMGVYRPLSKDRLWLLVNAEPQLDTDGSITQVLCTFSNITQLMEKKAKH
ncbi:MAG: PAS domain-containing protein [Coleofasciculaceae cyanobacterium]